MAVTLRRDESTDDAWSAMARELDRSRRYERPFGLVMITAEPGSRRRHDAGGDLLPRVRKWIRRIDHAWADGGRCFVLLPEADRAACDAFLERIRAELTLLERAEARQAVFPEDGLTGSALLAALAEPTADDIANGDGSRSHKLARVGHDAQTADASGA